jgi:4a-hydroxytetrahydrobiopterin dehydratase
MVAGAMSRAAASAAVTDLGWRYVLGAFVTTVPVPSLAVAGQIAARVAASAGAAAGDHVRLDVRTDRVVITVQTFSIGWTTDEDVEIVHLVTAALTGATRPVTAEVGGSPRSIQILEIAVDAIDIPAVRPFWKAVFGYASEGANDGPTDPLVDPWGQGPAIWFQQMDAPRPQRNRIHFDISVPHDEALRRMDTAILAGGRLVYDAEAPAFWVLADPEGNEVCITTWQGRD